MAQYTSEIILGDSYRHKKLKVEGIASSVTFHENSCERVAIVYMHDGDVREAFFDAVDLIHVETESPVSKEKAKPGGPARSFAGRSTTRQ